jgi:hypothetical protein
MRASATSSGHVLFPFPISFSPSRFHVGWLPDEEQDGWLGATRPLARLRGDASSSLGKNQLAAAGLS